MYLYPLYFGLVISKVLLKIKNEIENRCQIKHVIHKANAISEKVTKYYIGLTGNTYKTGGMVRTII